VANFRAPLTTSSDTTDRLSLEQEISLSPTFLRNMYVGLCEHQSLRRVYAGWIAHECVSVVPLTGQEGTRGEEAKID